MRQPRDLRGEADGWFADFAGREAVEPELTVMSGRMVDVIAVDVPEVGADPALLQDLRVAVHDGVGAYFSQGPHETPSEIYLPNAAKALGRALARRGYDIVFLQRCYRTLQRISWAEIMTAACREITDPELLTAVLERQWDHLSRTISHATDRAELSFFEEQQRHASTAQARRRGLIEAILREEKFDLETSTRLLGHNLQLVQTGLILWHPDEPDGEATAALESLAIDIASALRAPRPLVLVAGGRLLWAWMATPSTPETARIAQVVAAHPKHRGIRVAVGVPAPGVDGFRTSHQEAVRTYRIAAESDAAVTLYRDIELISCLASDVAALSRFVLRELGGLAERSVAAERLRETALVYLEQGSMAKAAEALTVHKNTVLYRIQQVEELLPEPIDEHRTTLEVALRAVATLGDRALPE